MYLFLNDETYHFELENIARFFDKELTVSLSKPKADGDFTYLRTGRVKGKLVYFCYCYCNGKRLYSKERLGEAGNKPAEISIGRTLYEMLSEAFETRPPWGIVTGIRPAKYAYQRYCETGSYDSVYKEFTESCLVSPQKARLAIETSKNSGFIHDLAGKRTASLYISIPFCPTRCSYCSFVSKTIERDGQRLLNDYVNCLARELYETLKLIDELGIKLLAVYFGGGTPSVLEPNDIERLTKVISDNFDASSLLEYTFEAGRPDTITEHKLKVLKSAGISRICINPQTFNDQVLKEIGRRHSAAAIDEAFGLARRVGFDNINSDLIAGLPKDNMESFQNSLKHLIALGPEGITVHALTVKRSSNLRETAVASSAAADMVSYAYNTLTESNYLPYYLYKQKGTVENVENVGYAKKGHFGLYNVFIMDELHTIIACGAGAVTKLVDPQGGIQRIYNYKYPAEYISGFGEMLKRKRSIYDCFQG